MPGGKHQVRSTALRTKQKGPPLEEPFRIPRSAYCATVILPCMPRAACGRQVKRYSPAGAPAKEIA
jgi:hypothetical protein